MNKQSKFPDGWDKKRVEDVLSHYESQSEDEAVAEDEAAYANPTHTFVGIPNEMLPKVRELLARNTA